MAAQEHVSAPWKPQRLSSARYNAAAVTLHWLIAALIVVQLLLGWWMNEWVPDRSPQQDAIQTWHVSVGITLLLLVLVRIGVRLAYRPPPLPPSITPGERRLIQITHGLFYVLLLVIPLTGWLLVSIGSDPVQVWGLPWPRLPGAAMFRPHRDWRHALKSVHTYWLIWLVLINLALHIAGALRHQFDGHPVLWRMGVGRPPSI